MPPKASQKPKTEDKPAKPASKRVRKPVETSPKEPKEVKIPNILEHDPASPIDVTYETDTLHANITKNGDYSQTLKLTSPAAFTLVKSTILTEGELAGCQAIIIRPAKAFPLLKLPKEVRKQVYTYYFAPQGVLDKEIPIEGRRTQATKDLYAKSYAEGSKNRVALLAVNKEIHAEAVGCLYENKLRFETTTTLNDFLVQLLPAVRGRLRHVAINTWVKTTSRNTMMLLSESRHLKSLHIESNVFSEGDPGKAAKYFLGEAGKFLEVVAATKGAEDKTLTNGEGKKAAVDVVSFGNKALTYKDEGGKARAWGKEIREEFRAAVVGRMK